MKISRAGILYSALPNLILLVLFYSLAVHMWQALGGWPRSIGEEGFPNLLVSHAHITQGFFGVLLLSALFAAPIAIFLCLIVRRWHFLVPYFALYAFLFFACWGLMQLAPKAFLNWWWD
jgi:hypothetical protein